MIKKLVAVYDLKAKMSVGFAPVRNLDVAQRDFFALCSHPESSLVGQHPEDFALVDVGEYDDEKCEVSQNPERLSFVCFGSDFLALKDKPGRVSNATPQDKEKKEC